jgi:transposase-like protein
MITSDLIARKPRGRTGLSDWYAEVFEAQQAEGLKTTELAAQLKVTATNIYYWKRRLRERAEAARGPGAERSQVGLVEVRVAPVHEHDDASSSSTPLELRLTGARSILVPPGFDPDNLRALVGALEAC